MLIYTASKTNLATKQIAVALTEMIVRHVYGASELQAQEPLRVTDGGDRWTVIGARILEPGQHRPGTATFGRIEIDILKSNCQVVRFVQMAELPSQGKSNP